MVLRHLFQRIPGFQLQHLIQLVLLGMSIFMMVKAAHDEAYPLPLFGDLYGAPPPLSTHPRVSTPTPHPARPPRHVHFHDGEGCSRRSLPPAALRRTIWCSATSFNASPGFNSNTSSSSSSSACPFS